MLDFCIVIIRSDRLTLSSPMAKRLPMSLDFTWAALTESSAVFSASENSALGAATVSVCTTGGVSCGRVACAFSCAIIDWIWLLSIPPVLISTPVGSWRCFHETNFTFCSGAALQ